MRQVFLAMSLQCTLLLANPQAAAVAPTQSLPVQQEPAAATPIPATSQGISLPAGTEIAIRTTDRIESKTADLYREYAASLDGPVVVNGVTVLPAHTQAFLRVTEMKKAGFKTPASLTLALIAVSIYGQRVALETGTLASKSGPQGRKTAKGAAIGAGVGAGIGALAGGAVGAAAGAAVGGASGAVVSKVLNKGVEIAPETRFTYKLTQDAVINPQAGAPPTVVPPPLPVPAPAPVPIIMGQSIEEVTAALGPPDKIADLGSQKIYFFSGRKITFTDGKVSSISGGAEEQSAAAPLPTPAAPPPAPAPSSSIIVEPELIGAVYFQDEAGKLLPLERGELSSKRSLTKKGSFHEHREMDGASSPVRVKSGTKVLFVVKLANGVDPNTFLLCNLEPKKDIRELPAQSPILFNVTKFGESSYGLTPLKDLAEGEYAFIRRGLSDSYFFGIDGAPASKDR